MTTSRYYPTTAEIDSKMDELDKAGELDNEIEKLSEYHTSPVTIASLAPLANGMYPLNAVHALAEIAEAYKADMTTRYGHMEVTRPKTHEELIQQVRSVIYTSWPQPEETDNV